MQRIQSKHLLMRTGFRLCTMVILSNEILRIVFIKIIQVQLPIFIRHTFIFKKVLSQSVLSELPKVIHILNSSKLGFQIIPDPIPTRMKMSRIKMRITCGELKSRAMVAPGSTQLSSSQPNRQLRMPLQIKSG